MRHVVVVGASLAGVHAVEGLRDAGFDGEITLIGAEERLPYDRPPLSKQALRDGLPDNGNLLHPADWYGSLGIDLRLGRRAVSLDVVRHRVELAGGEEIDYDGLILATGSTARRIEPDGDAVPIHTLRAAEDCERLHDKMTASQHLVVIGAGFIGLEVAAIAKAMGLDVSVVELAPVPLARILGDEVGKWFSSYHSANGVNIYCANAVESVESAGQATKLHLRDGTTLLADVIVAGVGSIPAVGWLRSSGLEMTDAVMCDAYLRTSAPGVVAAGDIVRWYNPLFDEDMRIEQWTNAVEQGRYAAESLLGVVTSPYASVPYFWSDQFSAKMRFVGRANASQEVWVEQVGEQALVVLYGRDGLIRGALGVNAAHQVARYQEAIKDRVSWGDVVSG